MSSIVEVADPSSNDTSSHQYETVPNEEEAEGVERTETVHRVEKRFNRSHIIRDITIGLADGLTVPFALAAGLSSLGNRHLVILGCLAQLVASTISKAVGGWATLKAAEQHFWIERSNEILDVKNNIEAEIQEMIDVMQPYELDAQSLAPIIEKLSNNPENFVDFRMKFESEIEKPDHARFLSSAIIGTSYFVSGLIPLIPYFFIRDSILGLYISSGVTFACFILFGYIKALYVYPSKAIWSAMQSIFVGFFAAITAYGFVLLVKHHDDLFEFI
ncbi:unnamed protein product [Rhizophagus irregularis]|uniref:DUF125-domain-containing protein n=1 Tax=Rhizophagus irregularis TaxID=588596 RepID=A0A2I1GJH5_9GLOM|nr:DUF125-domain-containing protein [Rhizophagus irregularis]CAB4412683.1 unnamed protein product [Rhizophagus irregularis]